MTSEPSHQVVTVVDVTDLEDRPHLVPWLVQALEARGFRALGRLATGKRVESARLAFDGAERDRVDSWRDRAARTLLKDSEGTAYAVVDTLGDAPMLRLRTLLDDGSLVETVGQTSEGLPVPSSGRDIRRGYALSEAPGRAFQLVDVVDPDVVVPAHQALVRDVVGPQHLRPVEHDGRAAAVALWNAATMHLLLCAAADASYRKAVGVSLPVEKRPVFQHLP
jgi:hypothetical protein